LLLGVGLELEQGVHAVAALPLLEEGELLFALKAVPHGVGA
jgi:hypothetical protein